MDKGIGRLFDRLLENNLWNNTFLFFTSDNGAAMEGGSNYPLRGAKGEIFEGANKVPAFIAAPVLEKIGLEKNSTIDNLAHFVDIPTTILDVAGIKRDRNKVDGTSLITALTGSRMKNDRDSVIYHIDTGKKPEQEIRGNKHLQQLIQQSEISNSPLTYSFAIRYKDYKYIKSIHNLRTNVFPYRVLNNNWHWQPPPDWSGEISDSQDGNLSAPCQERF